MKEISNSDNIINARDVERRIEELESISDPEMLAQEAAESEGWQLVRDLGDGKLLFTNTNWKHSNEFESETWVALCDTFAIEIESIDDDELTKLKAFYDSFRLYADREATLIHEGHFEDYIKQQFVESVGEHRSDMWPFNCIDWEAASRDKWSEYSQAEFDGVTYLHL